MDYKQITKDFSERTKFIIDNYKGEFKVTLLVNCCLGLLVVPKEHYFNELPDIEIPESGELWGLSRTSVTVDCDKCGYKLSDILRRIRNGICHFKITSIPDEKNQIEYLVIKDRNNFSAQLSIQQLETLVTKLNEHIHKP